MFGLGLVQDLLTQAPLGASVLVLLLAQGVAMRWRHLLARLSFTAIWLAYCALAAAAVMLGWALQCVLMWRALPVAPSFYELILTAGLYPSLSYILARAHQMMRAAEDAV